MYKYKLIIDDLHWKEKILLSFLTKLEKNNKKKTNLKGRSMNGLNRIHLPRNDISKGKYNLLVSSIISLLRNYTGILLHVHIPDEECFFLWLDRLVRFIFSFNASCLLRYSEYWWF